MKYAQRKYDTMEDTAMPTSENDGLGELRADVRHIQADVTDIKANLRITNQRIDALDQKFDHKLEKSDQKFESFRKEVAERFAKVDQAISELKDSLSSAKIWALGLYVGLAGSLFYVLARGFHWLR